MNILKVKIPKSGSERSFLIKEQNGLVERISLTDSKMTTTYGSNLED